MAMLEQPALVVSDEREVEIDGQTWHTWTLGEDAPRDPERRARQEAKWANTKVDARQHVSNREATREHGAQLRGAISDFHAVEALARGLEQPASARPSSTIPISSRSPRCSPTAATRAR